MGTPSCLLRGAHPVFSRLVPLFIYIPLTLVSLLITNTKMVNFQYDLDIISTYIAHSEISSRAVRGNGLGGRGGGGTLLFLLTMVILIWTSRRFCLSVFLRGFPSASNG